MQSGGSWMYTSRWLKPYRHEYLTLYACAVLCWMAIKWRIFNTKQRGRSTSVWNLAIIYHKKGPLSRFLRTEGALSIMVFIITEFLYAWRHYSISSPWIVTCSGQWIAIKEQIFDQSSDQWITDQGVTSRQV